MTTFIETQNDTIEVTLERPEIVIKSKDGILRLEEGDARSLAFVIIGLSDGFRSKHPRKVG